MSKAKKRLLIIDSNALIHRAFHALPMLTSPTGEPTGAVYGYATILLKTIREFKPSYIAATFDRKEKTFRHDEYAEYKAHRVAAADELYAQIPVVKDLLEALGIPVFEKAGYEADDMIGTIATIVSREHPDIESIIVTGDQDTLQLVTDSVKVLMPHKGLAETKLYDADAVRERFGGLNPEQLIDYKALRGDPSDNIPGVKGIGEKGAVALLTDFSTIENLYKNIESDKIKDKTRELLKTYQESAILSKRLATIVCDAPMDFTITDCHLQIARKEAVIKLFQKLGFRKLLPQINTLPSTPEAPLVIEQKAKIRADKANYQLVDTAGKLEKFLNQLKKQKQFVFDTETSELNPFASEIVGFSFSWRAGSGYYLPANMVGLGRETLNAIFSDSNILKIGHNLKFDRQVIETHGFTLANASFDTMIASYLLNAGHRQHGLDALAFVELGYEMQPIEELIGKGKTEISMTEVPIEKVSWYACEDADITWQLYQKFSQELPEKNLQKLFDTLEMPLVEVLAAMERLGIKIDGQQLEKLSDKHGKRLKKIEQEAYEMAGKEFNLASPKQLKEVLFTTLQISTDGIGKTKTGISTAANELEKMRGKHPIIELILEYRELSKLKSTYLDALPQLIEEHDGRVHTSYNQTVAATGRLSSNAPNLQNIPIKTELGAEIRTAFIAKKGMRLVKIDYSQFELRIAATLADDQALIKAFQSGHDIHTQTAAAVHDVDPSDVTPAMRRQAKEINFGIIYGMGAWGLAQRTGIPPKEAQQFIDKYFERFQGIKRYLTETIASARDKGYVETMFGRRRYLPEINASNGAVRGGAERMAVNMPIQGTQADIIKLAMIEIYRQHPDVRMMLQVHDELVFEIPEAEVEKIVPELIRIMTTVVELKVPIAVEASVGSNWGDTEPFKA
ncbi:MAG: DNA polymerase I [Candidatus Buchananbacteria bacterium]|nr:DNA polymerase I [Candidatus Buchananbacteria bacterium]